MFQIVLLLTTKLFLFLLFIKIHFMKLYLFPILFIPFYFWGQDTTITKSNFPLLVSESISFLQFNTVRDPANVGMQGRNLTLSSFSNLPNDAFNEVHNQISFDGYINKKQSFGIGLYYTLDNWSNRLYQNSLGLALKKKVKNFHLGLAIEKRTLYIDSNSLVFGDMIDPRKGVLFPTNDHYRSNSLNTLNFKPSILYNNKHLKVGISINHFTEEYQSLTNGDSKTPMEINFNASYLFQLKQKWCYIPMIQFNQSAFSQQLEIHNIITFSDIRKIHFLDLSYTNQKSLNAQYGMNFNNHFKFYAKINIPIYYSNYFPLSAQASIQYTFQPKK